MTLNEIQRYLNRNKIRYHWSVTGESMSDVLFIKFGPKAKIAHDRFAVIGFEGMAVWLGNYMGSLSGWNESDIVFFTQARSLDNIKGLLNFVGYSDEALID